MTKPKRTLPEFEFPPVIEVVLGVQFSSLQGFSNLHFGLFYSKIRADFPKYEIKPPLDPIIEHFGQKPKIEGFPGISNFQLTPISEPDIRCWLKDDSETRLIQIQKDRFIQNWRKITGDEDYPRYDNLKPKFEAEWKRFCNFLEEENIKIPAIDQCEVTYVNHIEIGKGWKSHNEVNKVFSYWSGISSGNFLPETEKVSFKTSFVMPENKGRLHVTMQPAIRRTDAQEVLQLNLTARGKPSSGGIDGILQWFDLGHEWIVWGFTDFTTDNMHQIWGRKI